LRAQQTEFAIADHCNAVVTRDRNAFEYAARSGERFGKRRVFVGDVIRDGEKIVRGQLKKLGVRTIATDDPKHSPRSAVTRIAAAAEFAFAATGIYLTYDALPGFFDHADKFMTNCSVESRVAASDLQIGVADARQQHPDQWFIRVTGFSNVAD
jgi:hypothetical protein